MPTIKQLLTGALTEIRVARAGDAPHAIVLRARLDRPDQPGHRVRHLLFLGRAASGVDGAPLVPPPARARHRHDPERLVSDGLSGHVALDARGTGGAVVWPGDRA